VSASTPDTTGGETVRRDLVHDTCMEVNAGKIGASMLPIVCQVIAEDCKQDAGGEGCKKALHSLDEGLKTKGSSMLFAAAYAGRPDIVKTMIGMGATPDTPISTGWTPLLIASAEGREAAVTALLEAGGDPNVANTLGRTALMFASSYGFTPIVKDLLKHKADPNIAPKDETGWTALMASSDAGHAETVQALLAGGADPTAKDKSGRTAMDLAKAKGHSDVARTLGEAVHGK
jgi:ankyrin repeat protein